MCDYSLGEIPNRLAVEGEELVVHRFPTHTVGLASPGDLRQPYVTAVCIPPGAELILSGIPDYLQARWEVRDEEPVVFTQTSMEVNRHRDAVRFANGLESLLQNLPEGVRARVVSLGGQQTSAADAPMSEQSVFVF